MTDVLAYWPVVLAALVCIVGVASIVELALGLRSVPLLAQLPPLEGAGPKVSIVIAARDEARGIERALSSVLALRYPDFEVIAVDDRSVDGTGEILDRMREHSPRLRVVHVRELPSGWLGKNYALQRGADAATGELVLFTDADVVLEPTALSRAVRYLEEERIDHIAVGPDIELPTLPLALAVNFFTLAFMLYTKPWKAADPRSARHIGVGAFNLLRADLYRRIGGHTRIAMRPDDDLRLGRLVKESGARQRLCAGRDMVVVEWYPDLRAFVRGLQKNAFAGLDYSLPFFVAAVAASVLLNVWPFVAVVVTTGAARALYAVTALLAMAAYAFIAALNRSRPWLAIGYPVAALIFLYTVTLATIRTLVRGGIEWRGTWYSLEELRGGERRA